VGGRDPADRFPLAMKYAGRVDVFKHGKNVLLPLIASGHPAPSPAFNWSGFYVGAMGG
jgi:hypothetical protein